MDDLLREFVGETLDMMDAVAGDLVAWEADPADRSGLDRIFRTVHTVKGSSGFFDIPRISGIAHAAEELLDVLRSRRSAPTRASVAMVLAAFERIRELTQAIAASGTEPAGDDGRLIGALLADTRLATRPRDTISAQDVTQAEPMEAVRPDHLDGAGEVPAAWRSVRVPVDLLDQLMSGVSDLVLARNEVSAQMRSQGVDLFEMAAFERLSQLLASVRATVSNMRMVSLRHLYAPLPRLVRQVADELGKQVRLTMVGSEVEIDREVIESLRDPMLHILRNSIDHGLEASGERLAKGKPEIGHINVSARQSGNRILISVEDDGAGLSLESLTTRAIKAGHLTSETALTLSDVRKAELVFLPGLSTAQQVTGISGRGVGMDVVKANVERLGGSIRINNRPGLGVTLTLDVPMTLTIIAALAIDAGEQSFAIPRSAVDEVMLLSNDAVRCEATGAAGLVRIRDRILPLISIESVMGFAAADSSLSEDRALIVCRYGNGSAFALEVPDVRDHEELVIKPLPPALLAVGLYSGLSLPDNGEPMLVLDVEGIASAYVGSDQLIGAAAGTDEVAATRDDQTSWLCFTDQMGQRKQAIAMSTVERICEVPAAAILSSGGRVVATVDGEILPVAAPQADWNLYDKWRMIRLSDGCRTALLPVMRIGDMLEVEPHVLPADGSTGLLGMALIDGELVELVDSYALLAQFGSQPTQQPPSTSRSGSDSHSGSSSAEKMVWVVDPAGGEWAATFLVPTLTAAGYQVGIVDARDAIEDPEPTVIVLANDGPVAPMIVEKAGTVKRMSAYDRPGLMRLIEEKGARPPRRASRNIKGAAA